MMRTTTLRLPEEKLKLLKAIAGYEGSSMSRIFEEMADEYIRRHRETMELLRIPGFLDECREGLEEIRQGKGKRLDERSR
jgi:predicted transcriptional regulator